MHLSNEEEENYRFSLSKFESMLKTNKVYFFDSEEFEDIVLHYMDIGKMNLAKKALKLGLEQHPKSTGLKIVQIEMFVYEDKLDIAEKIVKELQDLEPTNEEVYIQKANIFSKKGQHKNAVEQLKIAVQYSEDEAEIYSMIGMEYLFMDDLENAKINFIKCLEEDTEDYSALYNVVYCFDFLEQNQDAITYLDAFIQKNPYSEVAWHQLGRQYYALKNYEKAVWAFDYATLIDETFLGAFLEKAKAFERQKKYNEAVECYIITLELDDITAFALLRVGKCYEKMKNNEMALLYYNKAVYEDPQLDKAWIAISNLYLKQKNYKLALHYLNKAIAISNDNKVYWKRYAALNEALQFFEEAVFGYRKAFEYGDYSLNNILLWCDNVVKIGEYQEAIEILVNAYTLFPNEAEIDFRMAALSFFYKKRKIGENYLIRGLELNTKKHLIIAEMFPSIWSSKKVQDIIKEFTK